MKFNFFILVLLTILLGVLSAYFLSMYNYKYLKHTIKSFEFSSTIEEKSDKVYIVIDTKKTLPKFANYEIILLTTDFDSINTVMISELQNDVLFTQNNSDMFYFKINSLEKKKYKIVLPKRHGEEIKNINATLMATPDNFIFGKMRIFSDGIKVK